MDKKWIWISVGGVIALTGGFFLFRALRNKFSNQAFTPVIPTILSPTSNTTNSSNSSANPFKSKAEVLAFQKWVINVKGDKTILGSGGATGFGDDGIYGSKSASAWKKYGAEYLASNNSSSNSSGYVPPSSNDFVTLKSIIGAFTKEVNNSEKLQIVTSSDRPRIVIDFYADGLMVVQKDSNWYTPVYDKLSGTWAIQNGNAKLSLGNNNVTITPADNNGIWTLLKNSGYLSWTDGSFVPFDNEEEHNISLNKKIKLNDVPKRNKVKKNVRRNAMYDLGENTIENLM